MAQNAALDADGHAERARDDAVSRVKAGQAETEAQTTALAGAEAARQSAAGDRERAEAAVASTSALLAALESEVGALRKSIDSSGAPGRALDQVVAVPGYEHALAAALGDDLEATIGADGRRIWQGALTQPDDPALPAAGAPLSTHVTAPPELARRLAQVIVVEHDDGMVLAVGQRLVTRDGQLRRWDGFASAEHGAAAADRLVRVNRLQALDAQLLPARAAASAARAACAQASDDAKAALQLAEAARVARGRAEAMVRAAQREEDQASALIERAAAKRTALAGQMTQARGELELAQREHQAAHAARAAVPDGAAMQQLVTRLSTVTDAVRAKVAELRAAAASQDRDIVTKRERLSAARAQIKSWQSRAGEAARRVDEISKREQANAAEARALATAPERLAAQITTGDREVEALTVAADAARTAEVAAEIGLRGIEAKAAAVGEALATARETRAGAQARAENEDLRRIEMGRVSGERFECPPPLLPQVAGFDADQVRDASTESANLDRLANERERLGPVNLIAEQELAEIEETRISSAAERDELTEAIQRLRGSIHSLNREGRTRLMAAFVAVDGHFQRLFGQLFSGGAAHLELIDADDPLEAGLEIFAQPPGKKLTSLSLLSGGEQALTAVALIFGLFLTNPAPICVLDEVDAPLDDANIERFCDLLDAMTRETSTRYLIVTHNAVTMARMHRLFGVTMVEQGVSRLVSVDLSQAERLVA
jgi:chromosome segregation protein